MAIYNEVKEHLKDLSNDKELIEDISFYNAADSISKLSKCCSKQVGCVIVKDGTIISTGVNGTLKGKCNCNEIFYKDKSTNEYFYINDVNKSLDKIYDKEAHHNWSLINEIHAEMNAIHKAVTNGHYDLNGATAYISYSPCNNCLKMLALYGIKRIVYGNPYDDIDNAIAFCKDNNIELLDYSDYLVNTYEERYNTNKKGNK